jgi:hypothetical protein
MKCKKHLPNSYGGDAKPGALVVGIPATGVRKIEISLMAKAKSSPHHPRLKSRGNIFAPFFRTGIIH